MRFYVRSNTDPTDQQAFDTETHMLAVVLTDTDKDNINRMDPRLTIYASAADHVITPERFMQWLDEIKAAQS